MKVWKTIKLSELLKESRIKSSNPDTSKRIRVKLNVGGIEKRPDTNDKEGATKYFKRKSGQFIYGKQNLHKGAFGIVPDELDGYESSADIPAFDVHESCFPKWIFYYFKQGNYYLRLESLAKGVGSKRISTKQLLDLNIPLPPKEEQKKIIDAIVLFEQSVFLISKELERQSHLLLNLKGKILEEAVQGKITNEWRSEHYEEITASQMLNGIFNRTIGDIQRKKNGSASLAYKIKKTEMPFTLPESWQWCRLGSILQNIRYGTSKKCGYNLGDTFVLRIPNIIDGKIDLNDLKSTNLTSKEKNDLSIFENDLLIIRSNGSSSLVGRSAVVDSNASGYSFAGYLVRIRPFSDINAKYIHLVLESPFIRDAIEGSLRTTSGVKNINSGEISKLLIPLPGSNEQKEIVRKYELILVLYKRLNELVLENASRLENLIQIKLSEFYGELNISDMPIQTKKKSPKVIRAKNASLRQYNIIDMDLEELLKRNGKTPAILLWKMSKFENDIDAFYEELKRLVEIKKTVKESKQKGYLELVK